MVMYHEITFEEPIPTCRIFSLTFDGGKWRYHYRVETPVELKGELDLVIYGHVSDLYLVHSNDIKDGGVNIPVKSLENYVKLLELQREKDLLFRKLWLEKNPGRTIGERNRVKLENRDYPAEELRELGIMYVSSELEHSDMMTEFAVAKN